MRVVAGAARGIPLKVPKGDQVRPTVDRLKETLFNMIQAEIYERTVLDVLAGSGALGIEALSRGARCAYFCEKNKATVEVIKDNLRRTKLEEKAQVLTGDFSGGLEKIKGAGVKLDLVFLDPPYQEEDLYRRAIEALTEKKLLAEDALIIAETKSGFDFSFLEKYDIKSLKPINIYLCALMFKPVKKRLSIRQTMFGGRLFRFIEGRNEEIV